MKKVHVLLVLLVSVYCFADTVMIYTSPLPEVYRQTPRERQIIVAFENGVMNGLFNAGHIVFNYYGEVSQPVIGSDSTVLLMAKRGGAELLLEVEFIFSNKGSQETALAEKIAYRLVQVSDGTLLGEELLLVSDLHMKAQSSLSAQYEKMGEDLAYLSLHLF